MKRFALGAGAVLVGLCAVQGCGDSLEPTLPNVDVDGGGTDGGGADSGTPPAPAKYAVGGTITGLLGTGLVLQNSGGDDIPISANGAFTFPTELLSGADYAVTVKAQPMNLSQTCTVTKGTGKVASANVADVTVSCVTNQYKVGGTVTGLLGTGLVLQNNAGDDLTIAADGTFSFATSQADGSAFAVTVKTDPSDPAQTCIVGGGTGKIVGGNVTSVAVNCTTKKYTIGGTISGLVGTGLVLQNNAGDDLTVNVNDGTFAFPTPLEDLAAYAVTIKTQPTNPWQTCTVTNDTGNVAAAAVTSVNVTCSTSSFLVKATVTGLEGTGLVLQNNAGDDLPIANDGTFTFATSVASGAGYLVSVLTNPSNKSQTCTVTNGGGTIAGADVTDVTVTCVTNNYSVGGTITGLTASGLVLQNNAGSDISPASGATTFSFGTVASGSPYAVSVKTQPAGLICVVANASGTVGGSNVSVTVTCAMPGGQIGPNYSGEGYTQCVGYLDKANVEEIPNSGWADSCKTGSSLRIACGANAGAVRYIDVSKNVFALGLASYPESGLITATNFGPINDNNVWADNNNPNTSRSWWNGGSGCGEGNPNLTINNICQWEVSNCFGQNLAGDRFLYVYVKP